MPRSTVVIRDWEAFRGCVRARGVPRIWSGFAVELSSDTVVRPHLFDQARYRFAPRMAGAPVWHGIREAPTFLLTVVRGAAHGRFAARELVPAIERHVRHVVVVDGDRRTFRLAPLSGASVRPLETLPAVLEALLGTAVVDPAMLPALGRRDLPIAPERDRDLPRLWEALLGGGYNGRTELIGGEVTLVTEQPSPLLANRALMRLVGDAEAWTGERAGEARGFITAGPFRMRQLGTIVELRVRPSSSDRRIAFAPRARPPGADALPSLLGVLLAAGAQAAPGTPPDAAHVQLTSPEEAARLAEQVTATARRLAIPCAVEPDDRLLTARLGPAPV
jgi:hypothetical protein